MAFRFTVLAALILISLAINYCFSRPQSSSGFLLLTKQVQVVQANGDVCKDPNLVEANDFFLSGLLLKGNISNALGSAGVVSLIRVDYAFWGIMPPHIHPDASEIMTVLEGTLEAAFVTSSPENRLIKKALQKGDVFVFPKGLIHFHRNVGNSSAAAISAFYRQNPDFISIADTVLGSNPPITIDALLKAFQVDKNPFVLCGSLAAYAWNN
ncbi:putative germin-like protein 2-1 [Coffea arabica]|uniref:Germin-like protein n=1 Tax=Coffea arabica TaxID=13443 RepID=A0ABM4VMF3_COFAR